jgi:hypothetical protein
VPGLLESRLMQLTYLRSRCRINEIFMNLANAYDGARPRSTRSGPDMRERLLPSVCGAKSTLVVGLFLSRCGRTSAPPPPQVQDSYLDIRPLAYLS